MKKVLELCEKYEPLLRLIEVFCVVVAAIVVSYLQIGIANQQTAVAVKALEVSEAELKLANIQTEYQSLDHTPFFEFDHHGAFDHSSFPPFIISTRHSEIRNLKGNGVAFLLLKTPNGDRRIRLKNFYSRFSTYPNDNKVYSMYSGRLVLPTLLGFGPKHNLVPANNIIEEDYLAFHARAPNYDLIPFDICNYVYISYLTENGDMVEKHYEMKMPKEYIAPITSEPNWDKTIDLETYHPSEHEYNIPAIKAEVDKAINELKAS
jgi:hypothetical protein